MSWGLSSYGVTFSFVMPCLVDWQHDVPTKLCVDSYTHVFENRTLNLFGKKMTGCVRMFFFFCKFQLPEGCLSLDQISHTKFWQFSFQKLNFHYWMTAIENLDDICTVLKRCHVAMFSGCVTSLSSIILGVITRSSTFWRRPWSASTALSHCPFKLLYIT